MTLDASTTRFTICCPFLSPVLLQLGVLSVHAETGLVVDGLPLGGLDVVHGAKEIFLRTGWLADSVAEIVPESYWPGLRHGKEGGLRP